MSKRLSSYWSLCWFTVLFSFCTLTAAQTPTAVETPAADQPAAAPAESSTEASPSSAEPSSKKPEIPADQAQSLLKDLEDPVAREQLIQKLKVLIEVTEPEAPASEVQSATADLLKSVSKEVNSWTANIAQLADSMNQFPFILTWLRGQVADPYARLFWRDTLVQLAMVLGIGYLAFYVLRLLLIHPRRALAGRTSENLPARALLLCVVVLLDLFPIIAFAAATYVTLGVLDPAEHVRLVALAWVNAAIITRLVLSVGRAIFAPTIPNLRLLPVDDETAHYADIWIRRLTFTPVYGYFGLQAAFLLGLPATAYIALLRLLGMVVAGLVLIFIMQNRATVANYIRGKRPDESPARKVKFRALRSRLAQVWFLLASVYVIVLYGIWALAVTGGFLFLLRATLVTLLILAAGHFVLRLLNKIFKKGFRVSGDLRAQFPGLDARVNRYVPILHAGFRWLAYSFMVLGILQAWGVDTLEWLASDAGRVLTSTAAAIIGILIISVAVWELASSLIERALAETDRFGRVRVRSGRARTLLTVSRKALFILLLIVSTLLILSELGVNITPLLAGAGVLGIAVGFGSQKLVQDIITGVFILFEDLIAVGDVVNVGDKGGLVEAVSIRNVRLRDLAGTVHTIPYSAISTISNLTKDFSYYVFDVGVGYRENVDEVMDVLKDIGKKLQDDKQFGRLILDPLEVLGVDAFADSAVVIKARIKTLPIQQWTVGREFNRRMKKRFDELGIEIPFPHQTLYFGVDKDGNAPPAKVQLNPAVSAESAPLEKLAGEHGPNAGSPNQ